MNLVRIPFNAITTLPDDIRKQILSHTFDVLSLIKAGTKFSTLVALPSDVRAQLLSSNEDVVTLMRAGISFNAIVNLPEPIRTLILNYSHDVIRLITEKEITFEELVSRPPDEAFQILMVLEDAFL